jgi:malate dehydrogenase (oxaloacetate-decarboxylating)(NADP+)
VEEIVRVCQLMEPTFGGINLEDIKAPECFEIEARLKETMNIPVFHDDQHGTAIISGAALMNAMEIAGKSLDKIKVVFNGAGAAALACAGLYIRLGVAPENVLICDSKGVLYKGRKEGMNKYKEPFVRETSDRTLADAMRGADVFVGLSQANCVSREMVRSMAAGPAIFAMANPDPEITPEEVFSVRNDAIMATGRSDYPNQVNNVLGFPFIFRGALDVRATKINEEMKMAAVKALAALAKEPVPDYVLHAYGLKELKFGPNYIIPTPFDERLLSRVPVAVAKAAMETGVAQEMVDLALYKLDLESRLDHIMRMQRMSQKAAAAVAAD